jgi:hypothetical protein
MFSIFVVRIRICGTVIPAKLVRRSSGGAGILTLGQYFAYKVQMHPDPLRKEI